MTQSIKMSFTVELTVNPEDSVSGVLSKMRVIRSVISQLGFGRVSALKMETPKHAPDGLIEMLTESY